VLEAINKTNAVVEFDMQGNVLEVNDMYLAVIGYSRDELIGQNEKILLLKESGEQKRHSMIWDSLRSGSFMSGEYKRISKSGKEVWLNGTYNPIFDLQGHPMKVMQLAQFTTEEKERDLDLSSKLQALSEVFPLLDLDITGVIKRFNNVFLHHLGFTQRPSRNTTFIQLVHSQYQPENWEELWATWIEEGTAQSLTLAFEVQESAIIRYYNVNFHPIRNLSGKIYKVMVLMAEISQQIAQQHTLQEELAAERVKSTILQSEVSSDTESLLQNLLIQIEGLSAHSLEIVLNSANIATLQVDMQGTIIGANTMAAVKLLYPQADDLKNLPIETLFSDRTGRELGIRIAQGQVIQAKAVLRTLKITTFNAKIISLPIFLPGSTDYISAVFIL
jgi:PAS domain S-box-containing protein